MRALVRRWGDAALHAAGGDPAVVRALADAFRRADDGRAVLDRERNPRNGSIPPGAVKTLLNLLTVLISVVLSIVMLAADGPLPPGPLLLGGLHWLLAVNWLVGRAGPALLADADSDVLGWWPVTPRDLLLARVLRLLRDSLIFAAAAAGVPVLVLLFTGRPPVLAAALFGLGVVVQAVAVVFGVFTLAALLVRRLGRDKAVRLAALVSDGNFGWIIWLIVINVSFQAERITDHIDALAWLPPLWAGLWAAPTSPATFLRGVLLLSLTTAVLVVLGTRLAGAPAPAADGPRRRAAASSRHWTDPLEPLLAPWLPGREGWVTRRLLVAHLRNDWRFLASALAGPLMFAAMIFAAGHDDALSADAAHSAMLDIRFAFWIPFLAPTAFMAMLGSSRPEAIWPVALADLDGARLLAAQRRVGRVLLLAPMLVVYVVRAMQLGAPWPWALGDALLLAALWENGVLLLQERTRTMSFGRRIGHDQDAKRVAIMLLSLVFSMVNALLIFVYTVSPGGAAATWGLSLLLYGFLRWRLRALRGQRLRMDLVPE